MNKITLTVWKHKLFCHIKNRRYRWSIICWSHHSPFEDCMSADKLWRGQRNSQDKSRATGQLKLWTGPPEILGSRWCYQMETFSTLLALCAGNSPVTGEFPAQRPVTRNFDVFFDLRLKKRLSKQSRRPCFETPSRSLWRHCNVPGRSALSCDAIRTRERFSMTVPLWGETTSYRWIPLTKGQRCRTLKMSVLSTWTSCWTNIRFAVIGNALALMSRHFNDKIWHGQRNDHATQRATGRLDPSQIQGWWADLLHDDVIKRKHFRRYWPFVRGIHRSPVKSPHKGQWCGALVFSLIFAWTNGWVNNRDSGNSRRHRADYDFTVMLIFKFSSISHSQSPYAVSCEIIRNIEHTFLLFFVKAIWHVHKKSNLPV